jgi:hypothetical protein
MGEVVQFVPIEVWPLASYIADEMQARGWTAVDVANRMSGDYPHNVCEVNLMLAVQSDNMILDNLIPRVALAFGVSPEYFHALHRGWLRNPSARQPFTCPEGILDGMIFPDNDTK